MVSKTIMFLGVIVAAVAIAGASAAVFSSQPAKPPATPTADKPLEEILAESADTTEKELTVQVRFAEDPVPRGDTQTINVVVRDSKTEEPVENASVQIRERYASGSVTKSFAAFTDRTGAISLSWPIEDAFQTGAYETTVRVSANGYKLVTVETGFEVVTED
jgi:hypothetical protein